jgi:PAS domain S-box-containing protein
MASVNTGWSSQQLVEFLDAISNVKDVAMAADRAVERAAEALDAEIAAIVRERKLVASIGFPEDQVPTEQLIAAAYEEAELEVEGLGTCTVSSVPIGDDSCRRLVVARIGDEPFHTEDVNLLRGMGGILDLNLRLLLGIEEERTLRELSERETLERKRAEKKYRTLVERLPAIVYTADIGELGHFRYISPQIKQILGFTPDQWVDNPEMWASRIHPDDRERVLKVDVDRYGDPDPSPIDYRLRARDGRIRWVLDDGVIEQDASGAPYWHGVLYDITDRKLAEEESQRLKNEFFALVSHELRTPLTSIIGYLELIAEDPDGVPPKTKRSMGVIDRNAKRLLRLVGDLLFAAQMEAGTFEVEPGPVRIDKTAIDCVEAALPRADAVGVKLTIDAEPLATTVGDGSRLSQAIDNLLSNALKFTPPGGEVDVTVTHQGNVIAIRVKDSGIGIPEAERERLFDRFYRSSNALSGSAEGAGLGLAIVKAIVEGHGGEISVESEEGTGTTVTLRLPLAPWGDAPHPYARRVWAAKAEA